MKTVLLIIIYLFLATGCTELELATATNDVQPACADNSPHAWVFVLTSPADLPLVVSELNQLGAELHHVMPQLGAVAFTASSSIANILSHDFTGLLSIDLPTHLPDDLPVPRFAINDVVPWGWNRIGVQEAWLGGLGGARGLTVRVAIIDSGVDATHADLLDAVAGQTNFTTTDATAGSCTDDNGHGTHVAGIIAGAENDQGIIGVAPDASIYAAKSVLADGSGSLSAALAALDWALAQPTDLALLSPLLISSSPAACLAIHQATLAGLPIIVPAGEVAPSSAGPASNGFAHCTDVIVASAIDEMDFAPVFTPVDSAINLVAPGTYVVGPEPGNSWSVRSGTGMSAAFVVGAATLLLGRFPLLTPAGLADVLTSTATDLGDAGPDPVFGHGLVFPAAALRRALIGWDM